jgi:hypothetical protein
VWVDDDFGGVGEGWLVDVAGGVERGDVGVGGDGRVVFGEF